MEGDGQNLACFCNVTDQLDVAAPLGDLLEAKALGVEKGVRNRCSPVPSSDALVLAMSPPRFTAQSSAHCRQFKQWFLTPFSFGNARKKTGRGISEVRSSEF
jgi:hypothetical protein